MSVVSLPGGSGGLGFDDLVFASRMRKILAPAAASGILRMQVAIDPKRGFLFAGCAEGRLVVMDVDHNGNKLGEVSAGSGVDVIAYSPTLSHAYLPGAGSATMAFVGVAPNGRLTVLGTVPTARGALCVTADDRANAWVCDPDRGQLLVFKDSYGPGGS